MRIRFKKVWCGECSTMQFAGECGHERSVEPVYVRDHALGTINGRSDELIEQGEGGAPLAESEEARLTRAREASFAEGVKAGVRKAMENERARERIRAERPETCRHYLQSFMGKLLPCATPDCMRGARGQALAWAVMREASSRDLVERLDPYSIACLKIIFEREPDYLSNKWRWTLNPGQVDTSIDPVGFKELEAELKRWASN